ncbi:PREDICTED: upstream activation factor subunit spp27-like isoform X2 [Camelina sativa]|uniref:Upstream activation factor subunit spp27-like isoform X2 n=1 Tax=Camelina sativa TaxID=90675 RepID=A0ABM1QZ53_CAMSA|nr:PREDICTED: upstream activation factor subunit spp27-like isoform X2 [Camelina sativa]
MVSDLDLVTRLREILGSSDLEKATPASVRRQLEADFGVDFTDKKAFIRDQIDAFLETNGAVEEQEEETPKAEEEEEETPKAEEEEEDIDADGIKAAIELADGDGGSESEEKKEERPVKAKKRGGGFAKVSQLSPQLEKVVGTSQLGRTEVVKKLWAYIKEKGLQDPKDGRKIVCDELLHSLFRVKTINMFLMNKALSKHIWPLGEGDEYDAEDEASEGTDKKGEQNEEVGENKVEESEDEEVRNLRKRKRKTPAKSVEKPKRKGGGGGFAKICSLSPELQAFTGVTELARTEVVKLLWKYIKENKLQDPNDGRTIICNEPLRSLFPFESINMFQMNKLLTKHIWPLEDNAGESISSNSPKNGKQKMESDGDSEEPDEQDKRRRRKFLLPFHFQMQ